MGARDYVGPSRAGDQFHYHWAARQCLKLLPSADDLVAVTIEGPSPNETEGVGIESGMQLIDVGLYYGGESTDEARLVRYVQLKHSTQRTQKAWTASGLKKTIRGFAGRYAELCGRYSAEEMERRFRFEFTTNRPIDSKVMEALADLALGSSARHPRLHRTLVASTELDEPHRSRFFASFLVQGFEPDLWEQRNWLTYDIGAYLPDLDYDAPVQLKELVTRKVTTDSDRAIRRNDVLRALRVTDEQQLQPAPCNLNPAGTSPREQEAEVLQLLLTTEHPVIVHAGPGVGKSVLAARIAMSMPPGSEAVLYDCFGDGQYRSVLHPRHRHRDALVQIANELAARGLCHPLIPTPNADVQQYMRAFYGRLVQAIGLLRARNGDARLCLIIDAADNAEMAAEELGEPASFVRQLIRMQLPEDVRLAFTCRTHRIYRLKAPPKVLKCELFPFTDRESACHLRSAYPAASDAEVAEFAFVSSSNPRVQAQALAVAHGLPLQELLKQLGPEPTTVESAISELLEVAVAKLRDEVGAVETSQVDAICQALAVLRPWVPISILARLSDTPESAVRSFALELGRPLLVKGDSIQFLDEPTETWFRERFKPDELCLGSFVNRLRPLTADNSYAAAVLPQLLLQAGKMDELVELALSGQDLPTENPLEKRDVELQRLVFALKACLLQRRHLAAAKLALRAGGESAGQQRQNKLLQDNTDLAAVLMAPDRLEELVSRRTFSSSWKGSHHVYDAGLLSGRSEFAAEASSRLRMALDWLESWSRLPEEEREHERVSDGDSAEIAMALLRLRGPEEATEFLRSWTPRSHALEAGACLARRLIDLGRYEQIDELAEAAGNDVWLLLGLAAEARAVGRTLPAAPLSRMLRLLGDRRVRLPESQGWNTSWKVLFSVRSSVEIALQVLVPEPKKWAYILRRYLPATPPWDLSSRFGSSRAPLLRAYAIEAALRGQRVSLMDVAPRDVRKQLESGHHYGRSQETTVFLQEVGGLLPWCVISAEATCGRAPSNVAAAFASAIEEASAAVAQRYQQGNDLEQATAIVWFEILRDLGIANGDEFDTYRGWLKNRESLFWPSTLISLSRRSARAGGFEAFALELAANTFEVLEASREDAESRADLYIKLARSILTVSSDESRGYFERAVEIASRIGDENLDRWAAFLQLAGAAGERNRPRPKTAYRLSRVAELTYEYVSRDKHFDWRSTAEALTDLCATSALTILSRWRDRRFGEQGRLLPVVLYRLRTQGRVPPTAAVAFAGLNAQWDRLQDLKRVVSEETIPVRRAVATEIAFRYLRVLPMGGSWAEIRDLGRTCGVDSSDIDRLVAADRSGGSAQKHPTELEASLGGDREDRSANWNAIFNGVDLASADALYAAWVEVRAAGPPFKGEEFFRQAFHRVKVGQESALVRALTVWPDYGIFWLRSLLDSVPAPPPRRVSFRRALREAVLAACRREPQWAQRRRWTQIVPFEKLYAEGIVAERDVVRATLQGFTLRADSLDSGEFFQVVQALADCLSFDQAEEALGFGLDLLEEVLRPEDGDGPWSAALQPPEALTNALAGYLWAGLGSPVAAERWEYAHVVRSIVELDWAELLEALIAWATRGPADPFVDFGFQFYVWHARQWLLIGLARGAIENPSPLRAHESFLRSLVGEEHVLVRDFASQALRSLVASGAVRSDITEELDTINKSKLPEVVRDGRQPTAADTFDSEEVLSDEERYYFGIDIRPYWFGPLGRAFGLSEDSIERRARHALRQRMEWRGSVGWSRDMRYTRGIFKDGETSHSHGSMPRADDLTAYHGYHAMMLVAASLLEEKPVRRDSEEDTNQFDEWLSGHLLTRADGEWVADRRDPRLVEEPPPPDGYGDQLWRWSVTADYFDRKLMADEGATVLWGQWTSEQSEHVETVSIRSALATRAAAEALVAALQTARELHRFVLPGADDESELNTRSFNLIGWVVDPHVEPGLDARDPWAEALRYPGAAPSAEIVAQLALAASVDNRIWKAGSSKVWSETWINVERHGRQQEPVAGWRLTGDKDFLTLMSKAYPSYSLVLSVQVRRTSPKYVDSAVIESYPPPYIRYYLMGTDGVAHAL